MIKPGFCRVLSLLGFALLAASISMTASGQASKQVASVAASAKSDPINYEVQLHLLVASNEAGEKGSVPQSLEPVIRQNTHIGIDCEASSVNAPVAKRSDQSSFEFGRL